MAAAEVYIVSAACGGLGVIGGLAVGYYKAVSVLSEKFISKEDCQKCRVREDVASAAEDLRQGRQTFGQIRVDLAVIKTKLGIKNDLDTLRHAVEMLEGKTGGDPSGA